MFGKNEIVGRKFFAEAPQNSLYVTSVFYTLQGEGPFAGMPCVFVRLTKCNLACSFCDTFFDAGDWLTFAQLEAKVMQVMPKDPGFNIGLVVTGGEPLLQSNLGDALLYLFKNISLSWIQIESNGILTQTIGQLSEGFCLVVSPKASETHGRAERYLRPSPAMLQRADCLKFVMRAPLYEFDPYASIPQWALDWREVNHRPIYISPMNVYNDVPKAAKQVRLVAKEANAIPDLDMRSTLDEMVSFWEPGLFDLKQNEANHKHAARYCLDHGLRFNMQMHLYAGLA